MRTREHFDVELQTLHTQLLDLGRLTTTATGRALEALSRQDADLARHVMAEDRLVNGAQHQLEAHAINLIATQQPVARDMRRIIATITIGAELERIADYAKGIARLFLGEPGAPPLVAPAELLHLGESAQAVLNHTITALANSDEFAARTIGSDEEAIDANYRRVKQLLAALIAADSTAAVRNADLLFIAHNFERMGDRATNIAERIVYVSSGATVDLNP